MSLVTWNTSYSVKVARCDEDHKKLFALINNLHEAMSTGKGAGVVQHIVGELAAYAKYHFSTEESMMEKAKYPDLPSHRHQHQVFVEQVKEFQRDIAAGKSGQTISVAEFLNNWLTNHIKQTDQKYSAHLNANGIH